MSKAQRAEYKLNLDDIKENELKARHWKAQNDLMQEVLRNVELLPIYTEYLESLKPKNADTEDKQEEGVQ